MNNKQTLRGIFCDLQKAFGCVTHNIVLEKLKFYGIEGTFHTLVNSYLEDIYQKVIITNSNSNCNALADEMEIKHGVSQGLGLGPWFFNIY